MADVSITRLGSTTKDIYMTMSSFNGPWPDLGHNVSFSRYVTNDENGQIWSLDVTNAACC